MIKPLISKIHSLHNKQCERCGNIATQHIEHQMILGRKINFWGELIPLKKIRLEAVCDNCLNEQKRLEEIQFLTIVQLSDEYKKGHHYLNQNYVEQRLNQLNGES